MRRTVCLAFALTIACDATSTLRPDKAPASLTIVSGDGIADTVGQWLADPLVVEVRDSAGALLPHAKVRFEPINTPIPQDPFNTHSRLSVSPPDSSLEYFAYVAESDSKGRVAVRVKFSVWSGSLGVVISAPEGGVVDTARFTALPGPPYRIRFVTGDTALITGGAFAVHMIVQDNYLNVRDDAPALSVGGSMTSVDGQRVAHAGAPGPGYVAAKLDNVVDTMRVEVVPNATIAVIEQLPGGSYGLSVVSLDGLQRQQLVTTRAAIHMPAWSPSATELAYYEGINGGQGNARLFIVTTAGDRRALLPTLPVPLTTAFMPRWSPDGKWIYFTANASSEGMDTWHVHPDGTAAERMGGGSSDAAYWQPDPSPDGSKIALTIDSKIMLMDVVSFGTTAVVAGECPRYSPDGKTIAYHQPGLGSPIYLVNSDGTGAHQLTPAGRSYDRWAAHSWSPDGQWIIARGSSRLELVRVSTGEVMTLPYSASMLDPVFRP